MPLAPPKSLKDYAVTPRDIELCEALAKPGSTNDSIAVAMGIKPASVRAQLCHLRKKAAKQGWAPDHDMTRGVAPGFEVTGTSNLYSRDDNGDLVLSAQWLKTKRSREDLFEAMRIACEEFIAPLRDHLDPVPAPTKPCNEDLMAVYGLGDHHHGMYAWAAQTGDSYDCAISEKILRMAVRRLRAAAPRAHKALLLNVGDFFHADNETARTPGSGNALDVDTRHARVIQIGIRMVKRTVRMLLKKHNEVEVICVAGNHDPESSVWLAYMIDEAFSRDPRVTVRTGPRAHKFVEWGQCLIGTTHGDKGKPADLGPVMAYDQREAWGRVKFCHWYTGHVHHKTVQELPGVTVETLSVLCPGDAWHTGQGYRSQRGMQMDVWHKRQGRIMSVNGTVEYIHDR